MTEARRTRADDRDAEPSLRRFAPGRDDEALVALLTGSRWPFHVRPRLEPGDVRAMLAEGAYDGVSDRTFWVEIGGERAGVVRVTDIGDGDPQVDIRLAEGWRGRGLGRRAVALLVAEVFAELDVHRIEAQARRDNIASRRTLRACGFVKEAVYRRAYEPYVAPDGVAGGVEASGASPLDGVGYALLRTDWETGTSTPVDWDEEP